MDAFHTVGGTFGLRVKPKGQPRTGPKQPVIRARPLGSLGGFQNNSKHKRRRGKWKGVARTPAVKRAIHDTSTIFGFLRVEAQQLAQFHILRCFEDDIEIADLSSNRFWYWIYKTIRNKRWNYGDVFTSKTPTDIVESASQYFDACPVPTLPTRKDGSVILWDDDNTPDWRTDCLKTASKDMETNMNLMFSFDGYRGKLNSVIYQMLDRSHDFTKKVRVSVKNAVAKSLRLEERLSVVKTEFPALNVVTEDMIDTIQREVVDVIRPLLSADCSSQTANLFSTLKLRKLLIDKFHLETNLQLWIPSPQPEIECNVATLPFWSHPCEVVAGELAFVNEGTTQKQIRLLVRRSVDLMRMAFPSFVEPSDVGFPIHKNASPSRRAVVLALITDAVFGNGVINFESQTQSRLLTVLEREWCSRMAKEWKYPTSVEQLPEYLKRLEAHVRGLRVRQKVQTFRATKDKKKPRIQLPALCPIAQKKAVFVDISQEAAMKMATALLKQNNTDLAAKQLEVAKEEWSKAGKAYEPYDTTKKKKEDPITHPPLSEDAVNDLKRARDGAKMLFKDACWDMLFDIKLGSQKTWGFDGTLISDGVSVFAQCWRPKTTDELRVEELAKQIAAEKKKKIACGDVGCTKEGCSHGGKKKRKHVVDDNTATADELELHNLQEAELRGGLERARVLLKEPNHRQPRIFDPGASGHEGIIFDEEAFATRGLPRDRMKRFERISLRKTEMSSKAGHKKRSKQMEKWMEADAAVSTFNDNAPRKTQLTKTKFAAEYCVPTNRSLGEVYNFHSADRVRRLRFDVASRTRRMLEEAVVAICGTSDREEQLRTVVVFGNASVNSGKTGHSRICHKALFDILRRRCCLITIDEFRSSKLCSSCHEQLKEAVVAEGRSKKSWKVRVCSNRLCHRTYFQRDLNAAINICQFFIWILNGVEFSTAFQRGHHQYPVDDGGGGGNNDDDDDDDDDDGIQEAN